MKVKERREHAGRPEHVPDVKTRKHVLGMASIGFDQERIAAVIEIDPKTLRRHYRYELDHAADKANAMVGTTFLQLATGGGDWRKANMRAVETWARFRMGWREPPQGLEFSGPNGGPIQTEAISAREFIEREIARLAARAGQGDDPQEVE